MIYNNNMIKQNLTSRYTYSCNMYNNCNVSGVYPEYFNIIIKFSKNEIIQYRRIE